MLRIAIVLLLLQLPLKFAFAETTSGHWDYGGADVVLYDGAYIWGEHTGIGRFVIPDGATVTVRPWNGVEGGTLTIKAENIWVGGTLDATGAGYTGGSGGAGGSGGGVPGTVPYGSDRFVGPHGSAGVGDGPFAGVAGLSEWGEVENWDGGDGGYLATESNGDTTFDHTLLMGSGGGGGACGWAHSPVIPFRLQPGGGGAGGCGGGRIVLHATATLQIEGIVRANGALGGNGDECNGGNVRPAEEGLGGISPDGAGDGARGGAGAGGGILLEAATVGIGAHAVVESLGGRGESTNGGTVKIFADELFRAKTSTIRAGRLYSEIATASLPDEISFMADNAGWRFRHAATLQAPIPRDGVGVGLRLEATAPDTFGYWESPAYSGTEEGKSYRVRYTVASSSPAADVPGLRLGTRSGYLNRAASLWIDSGRDGLFSPSAEGREYELTFRASEDERTLRLVYEMIHFQASDANGDLQLKDIQIEPLGYPYGGSRVKEWSFENDAEGWTVGGAPEFAAPTAAWNDGALTLRPTALGTFGCWTSPREVVLDPANRYVVTFEVESDTDQDFYLPAFRCRLNESSFHQASTLQVTSHMFSGESGPRKAWPVIYKVWLKPSGARADAKLIVAFDLLHFIAQDKPATLRLNRVQVEKIPPPQYPPWWAK